MRTKCDIYVSMYTMDVLLNEAETDDLLYLIFFSIQFKTCIHIIQSYKKQNCPTDHQKNVYLRMR